MTGTSDVNRAEDVIRLASEMRVENYTGSGWVPWYLLTDEQKLPWLVLAHDSVRASSYCMVCMRDLSYRSSMDCPCRDGEGFKAWRRQRLVFTASELDALPAGTVIGIGMQVVDAGELPYPLAMQKEDGLWFSPAVEDGVGSADFTADSFPASILWEVPRAE